MFKTYIITPNADVEKTKQILEPYSQVVFSPSPTEEDIIKNCTDADAIISLYEPITSKVMGTLTNLKFIALLSIGFNTVDINYATKANIHVSNNPNYCIEEVADHTSALILTLSRKILEYNKSVQDEKIWKHDAIGQKLHRMSSRTLGLIGFGSIAKKVAHRMQSFGCKVIAMDPFISKAIGEEYDVEMVTIEELLKNSDIISLHLPLNDNTQGFLNRQLFDKMEKRPMLINCARGELVVEEDLVYALNSGLVSSAGLDVLASEPPNFNNFELLNRDNVIITPHMGFYSEESIEECHDLTARYVKYFINNQYNKIPLVV